MTDFVISSWSEYKVSVASIIDQAEREPLLSLTLTAREASKYQGLYIWKVEKGV